MNFLDFLNNPEVELLTIDRSDEQNDKRIKGGKPPIPTQKLIKLTGKLKVYINKLESDGLYKVSHRFWVRGHFRTLRNKTRYGSNSGKKIWILPYIKGSGILIDKNYEVALPPKEEVEI